jgi:outer membrane lipopolysaccharide assembly protein LptE/RlpB
MFRIEIIMNNIIGNRLACDYNLKAYFIINILLYNLILNIYGASSCKKLSFAARRELYESGAKLKNVSRETFAIAVVKPY